MSVRRHLAITVAAVILARLAAAVAMAPGRSGHPGAALEPLAPIQEAAAPAQAARNWVARENQRPGTTAWRITRRGAPDAIEGWADHVSATSGDRVRLYVSTTAPRFQVQAYRMGWYGGLGARLVWRLAQLPGRHQPPPVRTPDTNLVAAAWRPSVALTIGPAWPPGDYLLKLVSSSG